MPCGQKKSASEIIHSHTVTPPLAAMDGTTFRLKTATTNSRTRSHRPSTRRRCGASCATGADGAAMTSFANGVFSMNDRTRQTSAQPRPQMPRRAAAGDVGLQAGLLDNGAVAFGQFFAEFVHVLVAFPRKDFAERRETGRHRRTVGVVGAAVKNFMLGNQIHPCAAGAEGSERQAA